MAKSGFYLRVSNRTFEHFSGHGYVDSGGTSAQVIPLGDFWSLHLCVDDTLYDDAGRVAGIRFRDKEDGSLYDVFPGEVYSISVWTTGVDDDGCPEDICIHFYLELIPPEAVPDELRR